jgi:hypothetical protein
LAKKGKDYNVPDNIEILPDESVINSNNTKNEPDSFDTIFLDSKAMAIVVAYSANNEDDSNNNGTEGTQGTEFRDKSEGIEVFSDLVTSNNSVVSGNDINNIHNNTQDIIKNYDGSISKNSDNTSAYPIIPSQSSQSSHINSNQLDPSEHPDSSNGTMLTKGKTSTIVQQQVNKKDQNEQ